MLRLPEQERTRFHSLIKGQAAGYGLEPDEYLRKIWYHEQASRIGEYVAMALLEDLLKLVSYERTELSAG